MLATKSLETFFKENLVNDMDFFLFYRDKKLLEESNYAGFAKEQLRKIKGVFVSIAFALIYGSYYIIKSFIDYGSDGQIMNLVMGILALIFMCGILFIATKKYYTVKSSMDLFLKLLNENEEK